jgi:hypothetical protein
MIYSRNGEKYKVVANCGKIKPKSFVVSDTLLKLEAIDQFHQPTGNYRFQFMGFLKADFGYREIQAAVQNGPFINLSAPELVIAIDQAL